MPWLATDPWETGRPPLPCRSTVNVMSSLRGRMLSYASRAVTVNVLAKPLVVSDSVVPVATDVDEHVVVGCTSIVSVTVPLQWLTPEPPHFLQLSRTSERKHSLLDRTTPLATSSAATPLAVLCHFSCTPASSPAS